MVHAVFRDDSLLKARQARLGRASYNISRKFALLFPHRTKIIVVFKRVNKYEDNTNEDTV
jgi:hypothetical protein